MNPDADHGVRSICNINDVESVLSSDKASFVELRECVSIARDKGQWSLCRRSAERALEEIGLVTRSNRMSVLDAARTVVKMILKPVESLDSLPVFVREAQDWLQSKSQDFDAKNIGTELEVERILLSEILVLLSDSASESRIRLCSRLRKVDRSDLGIEVARPVIEIEPRNVAALTTLGAAYCDIGDHASAGSMIQTALLFDPGNIRAQVVMSRICQRTEQPEEAFRFAEEAFDTLPNEYTGRRYLEASTKIGDEEAIRAAVSEVERRAWSNGQEKPDVFLLLLAAEALETTNQLSDLQGVLKKIEMSGVSLKGESAIRYQRLKALSRLSKSNSGTASHRSQ
jgi:tetratricopeptide (TPR) repeat protein